MIIYSIDIGKTMGFCINDGGEIIQSYEMNIWDKDGYNYTWLASHLKSAIDVWKPDLILIPYPTRYYYVIIAHAKIMGIICYIAQKREVPVIEVQDCTCKKAVLNNGRAKKPDIEKYYPNIKGEHERDAALFAEAYLKMIK